MGNSACFSCFWTFSSLILSSIQYVLRHYSSLYFFLSLPYPTSKMPSVSALLWILFFSFLVQHPKRSSVCVCVDVCLIYYRKSPNTFNQFFLSACFTIHFLFSKETKSHTPMQPSPSMYDHSFYYNIFMVNNPIFSFWDQTANWRSSQK